MELNPQSGANNVTPSPEKKENVAGIQVSGGRMSDSVDGKTSGQEFHETEISAYGVANAPPSSSAKPNNKSTGIVVAGGTSSSGTGTTCHQCRQSNKTFLVACKNWKINKQCRIKICNRCLLNRYDEKAEEVGALADWSCPKCRGICNCSVCMIRKGENPTGVLHKKAKVTKEKEPRNSRSEGLAAGYSIEDLVGDSENDNKEEEKEEEEADIPLPAGIELRSVAGVAVRSEDVGNALQFLEFCFVFEEILELEKGEAENVLREILHGETARPTLTIQFHIRLLSLLEISTTLSPSDGENLWFQRLKKCFSRTQSLLKSSKVDSLLRAADYDSLNASEKLSILILLCDEVLGTVKIRNWMENENDELLKTVKEAKRKAHTARGKEKSLKQKMKEDIEKAIIAKDGAPLSISEHEAILFDAKSEAAQAHTEVLESEGILMRSKKTCDALRIEPLFTEHHGNAYWKLNSSQNSFVLQQHIGKGDTLTLDEKWYALDASSIEMIEKHVSSRGKKSRKRRAPEASSSRTQTVSGSA